MSEAGQGLEPFWKDLFPLPHILFFVAVMLPIPVEGAGGIPSPKLHAPGLGVYGGEEAEENAGWITFAIKVEYHPMSAVTAPVIPGPSPGLCAPLTPPAPSCEIRKVLNY